MGSNGNETRKTESSSLKGRFVVSCDGVVEKVNLITEIYAQGRNVTFRIGRDGGGE